MTDATTNWKLLRLKPNTSDDADWRGLQTTPNQMTFLVGGTTTAGIYSINLSGVVLTNQGLQVKVDFTATITRVAETDAQIAANLEADFDAGTANPGTSVLLSSLGIVASVDTATVTIVFPPGAYITATVTAPAPGTITTALGTVVPICASAPHYSRGGESSPDSVVVQVTAMDDAGATVLLPEDGGTDATFVLVGLEICVIETVNTDGSRSYSYRYAETETITGALLNTEYALSVRGAKWWTVRLHTFANPVDNVDSYEVIWRDGAV